MAALLGFLWPMASTVAVLAGLGTATIITCRSR
jgi:hypothetical protein